MAEESKDYVVYGMRAKCSEGTMENYISTDVGHGVTYQGQPLLNANDHTQQINLTHFGDCNSKKIYEDAKKQIDEKYKADANDGFFKKAFKWCAKTSAKIAITAKEYLTFHKCELDTPLPWMFCNDEHMIDGAPALTIESQCPCRFGGVITIVPVVEEAVEGETVGEEEIESTEVPMETAMGAVAAEVVKTASKAGKGGKGAKGADGKKKAADFNPNARYLNEETLAAINPRWAENMDTFKELYGENVLDEIGRTLYRYGVKDETSIMMFMSTMGTETGYGTNIAQIVGELSDEYYQNNRDKSGVPVISSDVGVGLLQLTGENQLAFIKDLYLSGGRNDKKKIEDYFGVSGNDFKNLGRGEYPQLENAAGFIYENYPIESAAWEWGQNDMKFATFNGNGSQNNYSINEYVLQQAANGSNMDNVFLATQYTINGRQNFTKVDLNEICGQKKNLWTEGKESLSVNGNISKFPNGWDDRNGDWQRAKGLMADE